MMLAFETFTVLFRPAFASLYAKEPPDKVSCRPVASLRNNEPAFNTNDGATLVDAVLKVRS